MDILGSITFVSGSHRPATVPVSIETPNATKGHQYPNRYNRSAIQGAAADPIQHVTDKTKFIRKNP